MAIAFDASSRTSGGTVTSLTVAHTCGGSNRILFVALYWAEGPLTDSGVTYNSVAMTAIHSAVNPTSGKRMSLYYLVAPATGANNIVASWPSSTLGTAYVLALSYTGAKQTGVPDASTTGGGTAGTQTATVTTIANNAWLVGFLYDSNLWSSTDIGTLRVSDDVFGNFLRGIDNGPKTPAGSLSVQASGTSGAGGYVAASFAPVPTPVTDNMFQGANF